MRFEFIRKDRLLSLVLRNVEVKTENKLGIPSVEKWDMF